MKMWSIETARHQFIVMADTAYEAIEEASDSLSEECRDEFESASSIEVAPFADDVFALPCFGATVADVCDAFHLNAVLFHKEKAVASE